LLRTGPTAVDLPAPDTKRWVARRKAALVSAVRSGAIRLEEACRRYQLSEQEFLAWERGIESHGVAGLRITRLQIYRHDPAKVPDTVAPGMSPEDLGAHRDGAGKRAAAKFTVGEAHPPRPECAPQLSQIEHNSTNYRDIAGDHPADRKRASRRSPGTKPARVFCFPVEVRFEDAVTTDGGPLRVPQPDPLRSLFGCATARCPE
jgi:hypothetical protein